MKKPFAAWLCLAFILGLVFILHAQETATSSGLAGAAPVAAAPDSIVQLTAEAQGLRLLPPGRLPATGTFWVITPDGVAAPWPCPPRPPGLPSYALTANGQFLVDATGGQVTPTDQEPVTDALAGLADAVVKLIDWIQQPPIRQPRRPVHPECQPDPAGGGD